MTVSSDSIGFSDIEIGSTCYPTSARTVTRPAILVTEMDTPGSDFAQDHANPAGFAFGTPLALFKSGSLNDSAGSIPGVVLRKAKLDFGICPAV